MAWGYRVARSLPEFKQRKCIIGVDQSYVRTGISIAVDGKLKKVTSINFKNYKDKTPKRDLLRTKLTSCVNKCISKYGKENVCIICERIRTFTSSTDIRPTVIKAAAALTSVIVDVGYHLGIETYSVDTRAWKCAVLGTSKMAEPIEGVKNPNKFGSVRKVIELGFEDSIWIKGRKKGTFSYDDDAADSACIALYPFYAKNHLLLKET